MQPHLVPGTLILPTGAVRMEGTTQEYMPLAFPAVPDFSLLSHLVQAAQALGYPFETGVVHCKDSFYGQHSPQRMPIGAQLTANWNAWKAAGVLASEMESAALFVIAATLQVRCATVLHMIWNQERTPDPMHTQAHHFDPDAEIRTAIAAMRRCIAADQAAQ